MTLEYALMNRKAASFMTLPGIYLALGQKPQWHFNKEIKRRPLVKAKFRVVSDERA